MKGVMLRLRLPRPVGITCYASFMYVGVSIAGYLGDLPIE